MIDFLMIKKIVAVTFVRGLGAISLFLMTIVIARNFHVESAGLFFLSLTIINILVTFGLLGFEQGALKFIGQYHDKSDWLSINAIISKSYVITGIFLLFISVLVALFAGEISVLAFNKPDLETYLFLLSPAILLLGLITLTAHQLQAMHHSLHSVFILSICIPLAFMSTIYILEPTEIQDILSWYVYVSAMVLIYSIVVLISFLQTINKSKIDMSVVLTTTFPLWIIVLMNQLIQWSGLLIAGVWAPAEDIAYLSVALRLAALLTFVLIVINMILAPKFAALSPKNDFREVQRLLHLSTLIMVVLAVPIMSIIILFPEWLMSLFGEGYGNGSLLLMILAFGQLVNVVTGAVAYLMMMTGYEKELRNIVLFSGLLSIVLALILVPIFGVLGAAVSTALTISFQNIATAYLVYKRLGINSIAVWQLFKK